MKKIVISGYHGFKNAGDEAILESILQILRKAAFERKEELEFTILTADPNKNSYKSHVTLVKRTSLFNIIKAIRSCDLFISGGGSLLQDKTGFGLSVFYYLGLVFLAQLFGKPTVLYAHGIGPINKRLNRTMARWIINKVDFVSVRDHESKEELYSMGVKKPPLRVTVDPAFYLQPRGSTSRDSGSKKISIEAKEKVAKIIADLPGKDNAPCMGISVREWMGKEGFLEEIAKAADYLVERLDFKVIFVPMFPKRDKLVSQKTASKMKHPAYVLEESLSTAELLALFSTMDFLLGVRLHSLIFAAIAGTPPVGIGYDPKVFSFLSQVGLEAAGDVDDLTAAGLVEKCLEVWQDKEAIEKRLSKTINEYRLEAESMGEEVFAFFFDSVGNKGDFS